LRTSYSKRAASAPGGSYEAAGGAPDRKIAQLRAPA